MPLNTGCSGEAAWCKEVTPSKGSYMLIIRLDSEITISYGRSAVSLDAGVYGYVGSARGTGGIRGRVCRHVLRKRWHVDGLILAGRRVGACWSLELDELALAFLIANKFPQAAPEFGNTDTKGPSHLFALDDCWPERVKALGIRCTGINK